jgi:hypothetical protein
MKYSKARQSKTKRNLFQNRCLRQILRIRLTDTNEELVVIVSHYSCKIFLFFYCFFIFMERTFFSTNFPPLRPLIPSLPGLAECEKIFISED